MDATPRLRSAFPQTPPRNPRDRRTIPGPNFGRGSPLSQREPKPLPQIPTLKSSPAPSSEPFIPEHIIDAPSQRLYAVALWVALWTWRIYDFTSLQESEEQSLWLFMKWVSLDGIFLFGLPSMRIPWLEWSSATMTLIFLAHAFADGMLMFRIPIPLGAGLMFLWRGVYGAYETAVNEHNVNPDTIMFNDSLILGRQVIHILPEGSAKLNPDREAFCIDQTRTDIKLPIMINATNPISMDILRVDLEAQSNETIHISKSQIKAMHKEASRLLSYSEDPNEPKTLYYTVKKPGLYLLAKVIDETNLEVSSRSRIAHTVVVPCPRAALMPTDSDHCRGELSNVNLQAVGTPPMKVKYRKMVNRRPQETTQLENIQPDDLTSPLYKSLVVPHKIETEWARTHTVQVPLSESLVEAGSWTYAIDEISDGFGNKVSYSRRDQEEQERPRAKAAHLHQSITVHERPTVHLDGCTPQKPLKVAKGQDKELPLRYSSTSRAAVPNTPYHLKYLFSLQDDMSATGEHASAPRELTMTIENSRKLPVIKEPGLYTLTGVSTDFCQGDVLEPASCLLQNPPEPQLSISEDQIFDKCAGSPIGLRVNLDLIGTPPFRVIYRSSREGDPHHHDEPYEVDGLRGQVDLTPRVAGTWTYRFVSISDAVYKNQKLSGMTLKQSVKPAASARLINNIKQTSCIDEQAKIRASLTGEGPFQLEYEVVHAGKRKKYTKEALTASDVTLETEPLRDGGDYTLALVSITDTNGCKEFLKDEHKVSVRHQKPKVSFGQIEGRRIVDTLEGEKVSLPLRLAGEAPWTVHYLDTNGREKNIRVNKPNDPILVDRSGLYELVSVSDSVCPGVVDESAKSFKVEWIPRPEYRVSRDFVDDSRLPILKKKEVCEGDDDAIEVLFKGSPPYDLSYVVNTKLSTGTVAPRNKDLRAASSIASLRMDTAQAGDYEYKIEKLKDANYLHSAGSFSSVTIQQKVNQRPSAAFANPGKTYGYCSVESEGEEVIPVNFIGQPPFELEVEIKHHGSIKPEIMKFTADAKTYNLRIPHSRLHLGKSAVSLRRVSDDRGCARTLDSTTPRVQISVHDAPTITPMESQVDYCVGDRINFALSGVAPFDIFYTFEGREKKARVNSGNTFRRLAEKPGTFAITGLQDSASSCRATTKLTKHIHGMPSVRVSKGRDSYVDIHEGGQAEITFDFGGVPPFEFTYTRSSNTEKGGRKPGVILDMRSEVSEEKSLKIWASEEGTYEVVAIKDAHCAYAKPGVSLEKGKQRRLQY